MRVELLSALRTRLLTSATLISALGDSSLIRFSWDAEEVLPGLSSTRKVALFWGADISVGGQTESGNTVLQRDPDTTITFHLFGYDVEVVHHAAEVLIDLLAEQTLESEHYRVLRIRRSSDTVLYEGSERCWHRAVGFDFQQIWKKNNGG